MALHLPLSIKLDRRAVARRDAFFARILRALRPPSGAEALAVHSFAFKNDEEDFARAVFDRHSRVWLFRSNQRAFCGDFVAVDMSSPAPSRRRAFVLELKRGAPLRTNGGGVGVQLRNAERAVKSLAGGVLGADPAWSAITGDGERILTWLARPLA